MKNQLLLILDKLDIELGDIKNTGYYIRRNLIELKNKKDVIICERNDLKNVENTDDINYFPYCNRYDGILGIFDDLKNVNLAYTKENVENCITWFYDIKNKYLRRKIEVVSKKNLSNKIDQYVINHKVFLKTVNKGNTSRVYDLKSDYYLYCLHGFLNSLDDNEPIFISQPVEMKKDELGRVEYRCFMSDRGIVSSISRLSYNGYVERNTLDHIIDFAEQVYLPKFSYCSLDIGMDSNDILFLVEINPIIASGVYYNNDLMKLICQK